ncbi:hypothetical protein ACIBI3_08830 [Actinomadura luteofluorescens]|uniref:hypothetical protein n=1 Tax=Actinomadura luteofluorescens TaxID=46163 RepID=UPI00348C9DF9
MDASAPRARAFGPRFRLAGISSAASGALFLLKSVLDLLVGDPPSESARLLPWIASHRLSLSLTNEVLFFAAVLLVPVVFALYRSLDGSGRSWVGFGCGILALAVAIVLVLVFVHGRLVYPVYGIDVDEPATVALVVSLYYGGMHEVALLLGAALVMLGLSMRGGVFGRAAAVFGVIAGTAQLAGAFPWLVGPLLTSIIQAMFALWLVLVGLRLVRSPIKG